MSDGWERLIRISGRTESKSKIAAENVNKSSMHGDAFGRDVCLVEGGVSLGSGMVLRMTRGLRVLALSER